jgi:Tfp pilus assembly protein PilN
VTAALQGDIAWPTLVRDISAVMPADVWLERIQGQRLATGGGQIEVSAKGSDHTSAARWLLRTEELSSVDGTWLSSSKKEELPDGRSVVTFTSSANLTAAAESDRATRFTGDVK